MSEPIPYEPRWLRVTGDDGQQHAIHLPGTLYLGAKHAHALTMQCQCSPRLVRGVVRHHVFRARDVVMGGERNH